MRSLTFAAILLAPVAVPLAAQDSGTGGHPHHGTGEHADHAVAGGGDVPAGWTVRADESSDLQNVRVAPMGKGFHVTLGPAVILYRERDGGGGSFHTLATFTQTKRLPHPEGYGLFYGGKSLAGDGQRYTYFLVRQDGKYLVKRREGGKTTEIKGWSAHRAIRTPDGEGSSTNRLEIDAKRDARRVVYKVNGQEVFSTAAQPADLEGIVGVRVNHNLDLHVEGFDVHR